ncbi:ArsR/SmtB family transcription factor [Anaeromicropila herbilytica]|uniref:Transcriptional regulator n=1 Tax=Anaeromicropila herbilytica TaxID=2785025 RepID=A0A7R7EQ34_9FIRM|nr:ArsR family transcriptional regulator [Anaeromicropila herbilytica]BCN32849.1 transcriptional regulator [Anaeromicropila herbilytica]
MLHCESMQEASIIFEALSTPVRRRIMEILYEDGDKNLNDLAKILELTNSAISLHIQKLEKAGLIIIHTTAGKRGSQKICKPKHEQIVIDLAPKKDLGCSYQDEIPIGYYSNFSIAPTCGISTLDGIIGEFDDPRYFSFPEHVNASILWLTSGFVEYNLPNHLIAGQELTELQISFEVSSECPGFNENYPSDIHFSINDIPLGYWVSPGDFGARHGRFTPEWWPENCNQYGLLKTLTINKSGTFIDGGNQISTTTISDLSIDYTSAISFRLYVPTDTKNVGGLTLFGKGFGDYSQSIKLITKYVE